MHNSSIAGIFDISTADVVESVTPTHWGLITPIELERIAYMRERVERKERLLKVMEQYASDVLAPDRHIYSPHGC